MISAPLVLYNHVTDFLALSSEGVSGVRGVELSEEDREVVSRELAKGESFRAIGRLLGRDHSVVSREVARNGGRGKYRAVHAQRRADVCRTRPKNHVLETNRRLHDVVNEGLAKKWSPRQVSRRLREDFPEDDTMRVSHETVYQTLYLQARGELRTQLKLALRQGRTRRVPRSRAAVARGKITGMVNISERPPEVEDRAVPGAWEGDLVRHEALCDRAEVKDLRRFVVAAA